MASKFYFNLKKAAIFQAVKWGRHLIFRLAKPLKRLFLVLFILSSLLFLYGFLPQNFSEESCKTYLGLSIIFLVFTIISWLLEPFFNSKLKKPELKLKIDEVISNQEEGDELRSSSRFADARVYNLAEFLSFEAAKAVFKSIKFAKSKKLPEIHSSILLYFLLRNNPKLNFIFSRALLDISGIKKTLEAYFKASGKTTFKEVYSKDFQDSILESLKNAQRKGHQRVEIGDILAALAKYDLIFKKILIDAKLKIQDVENLTWWLESLEDRITERKKFWEWKNLIKRGTLAKTWTAGYTILLDRFSIDLSEAIKKQGFPEIIGHKKEIKEMERILAREELNDVLLIGEPGTGRKSMILALAKKSVLGESLPEVNYKRIVQLDLPFLIAQTGSSGEAETILDKIFQEVVGAGNIILVIDNFHNFIGGKERPGAVDISGIIASYLKMSRSQIIGVTTFSGLHKNIEKSPSALALFGKVEVSETSQRETLMILENFALNLERKYKRFVTFAALRDIIKFCAKYYTTTPFPKKAMDLLDEVMVYVSTTKDKLVLPKHIAKIVSEKTQIPVGEIEIKEKEILLNLESLIHQRIINQDKAVDEVADALRRARAEVTIRRGPMGCFLFLGPTGVGKTETSKALAEVYFGSETKMIRMDMSEFQAIKDIPRLIGSSVEEGLLTTQVRENPFSLILLDEIEKAHPNVLNLFLQVLDEGFLTDGLGRKVDFKNSVIIATSNAGYKIILEALQAKTEWQNVKQRLLGYLFEKAIFRPEFINRFDAVVVFRPLSKENLLDIAELMLQKLKKNLKEKAVEFIITEELKGKIVELGYSPVFGAREMRRVIQDKVENVLASAFLSGELKRGNKVAVDPEEFKLIVNPGETLDKY